MLQNHQAILVNNIEELIATPFLGSTNAIGYKRDLQGDFKEIILKFETEENILTIECQDLLDLELSPAGQKARSAIICDFEQLKSIGASPVINLIKHYERDQSVPFFPTDVYSFHVDRSPIPTATYLCTYHGAASEILPNEQAQQKILIPEIREKLHQLYSGPVEGFDDFLSEYFFDLHYQASPNAHPYSLGKGNLWKLAVDHPNSPTLPCIHRAPQELEGEARLMLIC